MRQVYISRVTLTEGATPSHYIYDDLVGAGSVLKISNVAASFSGLQTTEDVKFFVEDGGVKKYLGEDFALVTGGTPHWMGDILIGEGDRVGAYLPDSAEDDVITLDVFGELIDIASWQGGK